MTTTFAKRAMLASLSISYWRARKTDKKESRRLTSERGTDPKAASVRKELLPQDAASYDTVEAAAAALRQEFTKQTLPWGEGLNGVRLLPAANFQRLMDLVSGKKLEFEVAVDEFLGEYGELRESAKKRLNGLYDESDYPAVSSMPGKFSVKLQILPFPEAADFRVELGNEELRRIQARIESDARAAVQTAAADLSGRFRSALERMADRLGGTTEKKDGRHVPAEFRDTLFANVRELVELIPALNLTGDSALEAASKAASERILSAFTPQQVRTDAAARAKALSEVDRILEMIPLPEVAQ